MPRHVSVFRWRVYDKRGDVPEYREDARVGIRWSGSERTIGIGRLSWIAGMTMTKPADQRHKRYVSG